VRDARPGRTQARQPAEQTVPAPVSQRPMGEPVVVAREAPQAAQLGLATAMLSRRDS